MFLTLRIESYRKQAPAEPVERRFDHLGGTIGRAPGNDLALPDPDKYISRTHCRVDYAQGSYTLIDVGSNPSWVNDRPLGAGRSEALADGDRVTIGDYVLQVTVDEPQQAVDVPLFAPEYLSQYPFQAQAQSPEPAICDPGPVDSLAAARILDTGPALGLQGCRDPLGLNLFGEGPGAGDPLAFRGSEPDHAPPQFAAFSEAAPQPMPPTPQVIPVAPAPAAQLLIPEDYDPLADFLAPPAQVAASGEPAAAAPTAAHVPAPVPIAGDGEVLQAMLRGLGLPDLAPGKPPAQVAGLVGAMLREATAGTMAVLLARAMTKRESRLELTVLGAQANNPLKFFPDAGGALAQMVTQAMPGYMAPVKAYASAFDDLKAHEMAVIAGMRAALAGVLARFDPALIESAMEPEGVMDKVLASSRKARMWDRMVELHGQIVREAQDDFQHLFGERFSCAYEDQIERLNQQKAQVRDHVVEP